MLTVHSPSYHLGFNPNQADLWKNLSLYVHYNSVSRDEGFFWSFWETGPLDDIGKYDWQTCDVGKTLEFLDHF